MWPLCVCFLKCSSFFLLQFRFRIVFVFFFSVPSYNATLILIYFFLLLFIPSWVQCVYDGCVLTSRLSHRLDWGKKKKKKKYGAIQSTVGHWTYTFLFFSFIWDAMSVYMCMWVWASGHASIVSKCMCMYINIHRHSIQWFYCFWFACEA